jgi:pimeloyl-ACP methyl ester carboxylesterase/DNA-binding CsgD family transcriptional regulator
LHSVIGVASFRSRRRPLASYNPFDAKSDDLVADPKQQIRFANSPDGTRIAYATTGEGPPFVKAASYLTHLEFDWVSPVWRPWLTELSRDHMFVRYDARGCGLSDREVPELSIDAWVRDLETVVDALELERFPLLGSSQGGAVSIVYAARHPERVSRLVLYGAFARGRFKQSDAPERRKQAEMMVDLARIGWGQENPAFRQFFTTQFIPDGTPEQHRWWNELERVSTSPEIAARFMQEMNLMDVTAFAPKVSCPTLVLHANGDARAPFDEGRLIASLIPGARFVPLQSRNHVLLESEPAWRVWLDEVRAFLSAGTASATVFPALTPRERELVELIAQGRDNAQIAARLELSEKTVKNHITSIFAKLGVENRSQTIVMCRDAGFGKKTS